MLNKKSVDFSTLLGAFGIDTFWKKSVYMQSITINILSINLPKEIQVDMMK
jgi:hypothetical protein